MEEYIKTLEDRIAQAEKHMNDLANLIAAGRIAGLDVSQYELQMSDLRAQIEKWKKSLEYLRAKYPKQEQAKK